MKLADEIIEAARRLRRAPKHIREHRALEEIVGVAAVSELMGVLEAYGNLLNHPRAVSVLAS